MVMKIFFCYAHEDQALLNKLKAHLRPLQRQGLIEMWHDQDISAGTNWEQEISQHLNSAQIILLLISPDFMNSDYCYSVELKQALDRHKRNEARVIPLILRPVVWSEAAFRELQVLPKEGKPVTTWANRDEAWSDVVSQLRDVIQPSAGNTPPTARTLVKSELTFARIAIDTSDGLWSEKDRSDLRSDPFGRTYVQYFYLNAFAYCSPRFDITLLNTTNKPVVLNDVGIEIVSVAHVDTSLPGGIPQSVKVKATESYTIPMPHIPSDIIKASYVQPVDLYEVVSIPVPDPIYLQAKAPFRYTLLLHDYVKRVPNKTILRMWLRTNQSQERSHELFISWDHTPSNVVRRFQSHPTVLSDVARLLPCGHEEYRLTARFCSVCGMPVSS